MIFIRKQSEKHENNEISLINYGHPGKLEGKIIIYYYFTVFIENNPDFY